MPMQEKCVKAFHDAVQGDFNEMMLGERLGEGVGREVFADRMNPRRVIKLEENGFQNVTEHLVWAALCDTVWAPWFARCFWISANGRVLIQERAFLPARRPPMPDLVPNFVNDARECNMGVVRGRWVFCDYGHTNLLRLGLQNFKWVPPADTPLVRPAEIEINEWQLP